MRVLVACEYSGTVRDAFRRLGHDAVSCDLLPTEAPGPHVVGDVLGVLDDGWDLMVAHPPCTHLCVSGARWFDEKQEEQREALEFVRTLLDAPILRIALENPVGVISSRIRPPDQIIQPWQFGHDASKSTCLWLQGLPSLVPTGPLVGPRIVDGLPRWANQSDTGQNRLGPGEGRWKIRSETYSGIAEAMAAQWGDARLVPVQTTLPLPRAATRDAAKEGPDDPYKHVVHCDDCEERWCLLCQEHWGKCPCPGPHDDPHHQKENER